jgi:hypothetical protein
MAQRVASSPSVAAIPPTASAALPQLDIPMPRIFGTTPPSLKGRVMPIAPLPDAPKNDGDEIRKIRFDINQCKNSIEGLTWSINNLKKENNIENNAEKLILIAQCYIHIFNIKRPATEDEAKRPVEYLTLALRALSTHRSEGNTKYGLLNEILQLCEQIRQLLPKEIEQLVMQSKMIQLFVQIEEVNELLEQNKFGYACETVPELSKLPPNPILTPQHLIAIIAILNAMAKDAPQEGKVQHLVRVPHFAKSALEKIQGLNDVPQQTLLLKSLEEQISKFITDHPDQKTLLKDLHTETKTLLNTLEPKWYASPLNITLFVVGILTVICGSFLYRRFNRA